MGQREPEGRGGASSCGDTDRRRIPLDAQQDSLSKLSGVLDSSRNGGGSANPSSVAPTARPLPLPIHPPGSRTGLPGGLGSSSSAPIRLDGSAASPFAAVDQVATRSRSASVTRGRLAGRPLAPKSTADTVKNDEGSRCERRVDVGLMPRRARVTTGLHDACCGCPTLRSASGRHSGGPVERDASEPRPAWSDGVSE